MPGKEIATRVAFIAAPRVIIDPAFNENHDKRLRFPSGSFHPFIRFHRDRFVNETSFGKFYRFSFFAEQGKNYFCNAKTIFARYTINHRGILQRIEVEPEQLLNAEKYINYSSRIYSFNFGKCQWFHATQKYFYVRIYSLFYANTRKIEYYSNKKLIRFYQSRCKYVLLKLRQRK